jgi:hypothetical protein
MAAAMDWCSTSDGVVAGSARDSLHSTNSETSLSTYSRDSLSAKLSSDDEDRTIRRISDWKKHTTQEQRRKHSNTISTSTTQPWLDSAVLDDVAPLSERRLPSRLRRESYRSVREDLDAPQSFIVTNSSRNAFADDMALEEETYDGAERIARAWKSSKLRSKLQSHSLSDLKKWFSSEKTFTLDSLARKDEIVVERSPLEKLPAEIIDNIFSVLGPYDPDRFDTLSKDLLSCMLASKAMYTLTIGSLYGNISIPHPMMFGRFMFRLREDPTIGNLVHRLDFSRYSNIGWGRTRQASMDAQNLNSKSLLECLDIMPNLQEFLVHEHLDDEMSEGILTRLVQMPNMRALDFCACSSRPFAEAFTSIATETFPNFFGEKPPVWLSQITRLSLHECTTLQAPVFEALLPQLPRLTHLDVAHTLITDDALDSIPHTARITHLNLSRCTQITGPRTVEFLTTHPAVRDSLVVLNIMADSKRYKLLDTEDCAALIPNLPYTLKSLNLGGAQLNDTHLPALLPLTRVLEELSVRDAHLSAAGLESIFREPEDLHANEKWHSSTLRYIDVSGVPELNHRSVNYSLDLLTTEQSLPLEVIELSEAVMKQLKGLKRPPGAPEWSSKEFGRRGWYVRNNEGRDSGARSWKNGSRWWGARKLPMAEMEVGGMYGYYMFKN